MPTNSEDKQSQWDQMREKLQIGDEVSGVVQHQAPFGVFIDIGAGFPTLLRITDFARDSDTPLEFPKDYPSVGSEVTGQIIAFEARYPQISLTQRQLSPEKWEELKKWDAETEDLVTPYIDNSTKEVEQIKWGKLKISRVFQIAGRGGVVASDTVRGTIRVGIWTQPLLIDGVRKRLKVSGVEFIDFREDGIAELGLLFESKPDSAALEAALLPDGIVMLSEEEDAAEAT